jgi:hypothetical protein
LVLSILPANEKVRRGGDGLLASGESALNFETWIFDGLRVTPSCMTTYPNAPLPLMRCWSVSATLSDHRLGSSWLAFHIFASRRTVDVPLILKRMR